METTISLAKEHGLAALTLLAVIYLSANTNGQFAALRDQINREHAEMRGEHTEMRGEHAEIRAEMNGEHVKLRGEHAELRVELNTELAELRGDMNQNHTDIRGTISEVSERAARVETRLGGIEERLGRDLPPGV